MPKPYPEEFRADMARVARAREDGVNIEQVALDFGVHPMTLRKWPRRRCSPLPDLDEIGRAARGA